MTLYDVLGASPGTSPAELRRAYLRAARRTHPDGGGTSEAFRSVQAAWQVLGDPRRRAAYDAEHVLEPVPGLFPEWSGPLVRTPRLSALGPVALSGTMLAGLLGATSPVLLVAAAAYVLLTLLALARRLHPGLGWLRWPGERAYRVLVRGGWGLALGFALLSALAWTLDRSPTTPLLWTLCATVLAIATTVAGELAPREGG